MTGFVRKSLGKILQHAKKTFSEKYNKALLLLKSNSGQKVYYST